MASNYPGSLDSLTNPSPTDSELTVSHSAQHANANDAIEAIQAELGTDPAGSEATVAARLTAIEATGTGVSGPGSSTDNALVRWDGTGGDTVQNSGVTVDDSGNLTAAANVTADSAGHAYLNADAASGGYVSGVRFQENGSTFWFAEKLTSGSSRNFRIQNDSSQGMTLAYSGGAATFTSDVTVGGDIELGSGGPTITTGTGSPESAVSAPVGSLYTRTDGSTSTTLYVKESGTGNTGWVAK